MQSLTREQTRDLERHAIQGLGIPASVLMENAGRGAAYVLLGLGIHGPVAICCGKGNNGGDGLVLARHLANAEVAATVHLFANPGDLSEEAARQYRILQGAGLPAHVWDLIALDESDLAKTLGRAEWVVDGLFGTGLTGPVRPPFDRIITTINASPAAVFALDIPSGLDADTGEPQGATIRARATATFLAPKAGFANPVARHFAGRVQVVDIGVPNTMKS